MTAREHAQLDDMIAAVTANTNDDTAAVAAFTKEIKSSLKVPVLGLVLGQRVQIDGVELPNARRGIIAMLRKDGRSRQVSLLDVVIPGRSRGALLVGAYQRWAGAAGTGGDDPADTGVAAPSGTVDAVVLKVGSETARLRPLDQDQEITLRGSGADLWKVVPGQIVTVKPSKRWTHRNYHYMSGQVVASRVDIAALALRPLLVDDHGPAPLAPPYGTELGGLWSSVAAGRNVAYELETVIPGVDESREDDGVIEALDLRDAGDTEAAEKVLMELLHVDLRCLDAHELLGEWAFDMKYDGLAAKALLHFEVGVGIGEHSLGAGFDGRAPWSLMGNRPFLRCLQGYGLALWRHGRAAEAAKAFERLCRLNPSDETDAKLAWKAVNQGAAWAGWSSTAWRTVA